jgi:hypothetical protein
LRRPAVVSSLLLPPSKVRPTLDETLRPTLRGLVTGSVKLGRQLDAVHVVVWGDEFPSWLLVLAELHLKARVVVLSGETRLTLVKSLVEEDCLIVTETKAREILGPHTLNNSSLCLVDGRVTSDTARFLERCGITRIIGTKGIRRKIPGWSHATWTGDHTRLGGVTTASISGMCLALGAETPRAIERPDEIGRDASTVLSIKAPARQYRSAPSKCTVEPLSCVDVGTTRFPCFQCRQRTMVPTHA